jgi:phosphatidylethanolamine-binding protein (PEBP) family uncharacterized protein
MSLRDCDRVMTAGRKVLLGSLCATMALAGCGGSSTTSGSSSATKTARFASVPNESIEVSIPGLLREGYIPERYTCDGADVSFPLRWSHVPSGTAELAIFVINLQPVHGRFFFDWALTGLSATSHGISAGTLPPGAIVGRNSFGAVGYSICPAKGASEEHYVVRAIALPHPLAATPGFDAEAVYREAERSATVVGLGGGVYKPPSA